MTVIYNKVTAIYTASPGVHGPLYNSWVQRYVFYSYSGVPARSRHAVLRLFNISPAFDHNRSFEPRLIAAVCPYRLVVAFLQARRATTGKNGGQDACKQLRAAGERVEKTKWEDLCRNDRLCV